MRRLFAFGSPFFFFAAPVSAQLVSIQLNYPPKELMAGIEGTAGFEVQLSTTGKVTECKIIQTTGNDNLDRETCTQLRKTGKFKPATDPAGKPKKSTYKGKLRWSIPSAASAGQPVPSS